MVGMRLEELFEAALRLLDLPEREQYFSVDRADPGIFWVRLFELLDRGEGLRGAGRWPATG